MGAARACLCWGFSSFRGSCKPRVVTSCHGNRRHSRGNHPQEVFLKDPPPSSLFSCPPVLCTEARVLARRPARPPLSAETSGFQRSEGSRAGSHGNRTGAPLAQLPTSTTFSLSIPDLPSLVCHPVRGNILVSEEKAL